MLKEEFRENFLYHAKKMDISINDVQIEKFYKYMQLLLEWNEKINLTAITEEEDVILKHFIDSLTIIKYIKKDDKIIDVGTGAGFPGIPIKIIMEDTQIVLMDSLNKRINFLNNVIEELELDGIEAIHSRAEELGKNKEYREKFDIATSRAVANMSTLSEYLVPFVKIKGIIICMKGSSIEEELNEARKAISVLGGKIIELSDFLLSDTDIKRHNVIIEKVKQTPNMYPRKAGIPSKEPIS